MVNQALKKRSIESGSTLIAGGLTSSRASAYKIIKELEDRISGYKTQVEFAELVQKSCDMLPYFPRTKKTVKMR